ncbi:MAG TPA: acyl-CoA dehydrogenase family protein [Candidatus Dormibacteraeota bacterium]|nr:acyl-CoA dehydrogenase family protein [Candidatus Dormibacteraeota bacterium]
MVTEVREDLQAIQSSVRELAQAKIAPRAAEIDRTTEFPWDVVELFRQQDIFAIAFTPEYGGVSGSSLTLAAAVEEIAKVCATSALLLAVQGLGGYPLLLGGSEEQKRAFLPELASGQKLAAYALSEPDAGSDPGSMTTRARRDGDDYVLDGTKTWISQGTVADLIVVFAVTAPDSGTRGISAFLVDGDSKGLRRNSIHGKLGIRGSDTGELVFSDCRVPADRLLGDEGEGFKIAMGVLDRSRPQIAAQALGIAAGALEYAVKYSRERRQFGRPIAEFQGLQFMLADMATQVEAARCLTHEACRAVDAQDAQMTSLAAMAKLAASDAAMRVTTDAVQILGGYGYINEFPVERMMRDAKITQIYEGTNQIQRVVIAKALLKGGLPVS